MKRLSTHLFELGAPPDPGAAVVIHCPFAGGSVFSLREYRDLLPGYHHLAVHYPGRGFRCDDPPADSVSDLADAVAEEFLALAPADQPGPLLVGHSMGAYVAVETALRLRSAGVRCSGLIVSSALLPGVVEPAESPLWLLSGEQPLAEVSDRTLVRALIDGGALPAEILDEPEVLAMVLPALRQDVEIAAEYRAAGPSARLDCPVIAFGGHDDEAVPPESLADWRTVTDGGFTARLWAGDHFWFREPQPGLADAVQGALRPRTGESAVGAAVTVDALVRAQVLARPEAAAVVDGGTRYSYTELWEGAGRIAGALAARGIGEGDIVGIRVGRGIRAVSAMLGVARTGAMYLPLNENDPEPRRARILRDAAPALLLVDEERSPHPGDAVELPVGTLLADAGAPEPPPERHGPGSALYVMYTSGSTGTPKGVIVEHSGVLNLVTEPRLDLTSERVVAHCASDAFDVSTFEIWGALCAGGTCVTLAPRDLLEPEVLRAAITDHAIDTLFVTTAVLNFLTEEALPELRRLHALVFGGERASARHLHLMLDHLSGSGTRLVHAYGPTEATMMSTLIDLDQDNCDWAPIGTALHNLRAILLDVSGEVVDGDGTGELCIAGPSLARGYLNRPELTAERFVDLRLPSGPLRAYRTGDECERAGEVLRFVGRRDGMVKVRSHRIELGEVESGLCAHPDVLEAVVVLDESPGEPQLTAYLRTAASLDADDLRRFLTERLPGYMIPTRVHSVDEFPLGVTGKVDRSALASLKAGHRNG